jgi:membrane protein YdbS with pleckstrin-like domain
MERELELIQKIDNLDRKIDRNHRQLLTGLIAIAAGIFAAALALAVGWSIRGAAFGCIGAGVVTLLIAPDLLRRKAYGGWR